MIIPTSEIKRVQKFIFKHGCIVVEDNPTIEKDHPMIPVTNHKVMKIVKSMNSKGLFDREFIWNHAYYRLNAEGIEYLRESLLLGPYDCPETHISIKPTGEQELAAEGEAY
ncbi:small subunit ribosomal protein S10e [Nematocida sp. AWRm77]|nr:small subunit ribosomal protein S10e [Nematocida sp. AWRm77]